MTEREEVLDLLSRLFRWSGFSMALAAAMLLVFPPWGGVDDVSADPLSGAVWTSIIKWGQSQREHL